MSGQGLPGEPGKHMWLTEAHTSQEAPSSVRGSSSPVAVNNQNFEKISKDEKTLNAVKEVFGDNAQINEYKFSSDFLSKDGIERKIKSENNFKLEKINIEKENSKENNY